MRCRPRVWPRPALSARARPGTARASISRCSRRMPRRSSCACSTARAARGGAHRAARIHRRGLARLSARGAAGPALRLSRPRTLRPGERPPLQPEQAAARPLRQGAARARCAGTTRMFGYRVGSPRDDLSFDRRDSARYMPKCRVVETAFTWGDDRRPRTPLGRDDHLRDARRAASRCAHPDIARAQRGTFAGARLARRHRLSGRARRHRGRAAAGPRLRSTTAIWSSAACAITGATTRSASSRPSRAISPAAIDRRVQDHGRSGCTTPASRSSSTSSTTTPAKAINSARRCRSAASTTLSYYRLRRRPALLSGHHRHRQHAEPRPSARAADGHGFAALLGRGDARRRLPLRSCDDARRARTATIDQDSASSTRCGRTRCCRRSS